MHLAQNGGDEPLMPGDVVVFAGVVEPEESGGILVVQVTKASQANSPVVQAPTQARASAQSGAIQPGDLLSSCPRAGTAAGVREISVDGVRVAAPGTVFGKALEALDAPEGPIYVFVTLQ